MQFTTFVVATLSAASAVLAQTSDVKVHVVQVSSSGTNQLTFNPSSVNASVGDMVQYQFNGFNHSVAQSDFDHPCQPLISTSSPKQVGIWSGYMPVTAGSDKIPTFTVLINNTNPLWIYCTQAKHCQSGMVMAINENPAKNATRTLANYKAAAAKASANITPGETAGTNGTDGSIANSTSTSGSDSSSSSGSSTGSAASATGTGAASGLHVPAVSVLLALGAAALFL